jgi:uncharacterized protein (TIGR01244 family)
MDGVTMMAAWSRRLLSCLVVAMALLAAGGFAVAQSSGIEVPVRDLIRSQIANYGKLRPQIATAGLLGEGAIAELKSFGFATILDLRGPEEGTAVERAAAAAAGLRYLIIPYTAAVPSEAQIAEFGRVVDDAGNRPLMIHCGSANRVGAMWALYRIKSGTPAQVAFSEGRAIGMQASRENALRTQLGLPAAR